MILPGAHHGFDLLGLSLAPTRGASSHGFRVECEDVTTTSIAKVRDFL